MKSDDKLTLAEQIYGLQIVDGEKVITVGQSIEQIDFLAQALREQINSRRMSPRTRDAAHRLLDEQVMQAKETILRLRGDP